MTYKHLVVTEIFYGKKKKERLKQTKNQKYYKDRICERDTGAKSQSCNNLVNELNEVVLDYYPEFKINI